MNKNERIDEFLKFLRDIIVQNPQYKLSSDAIYGQLVRMNITPQKKGINEPLFERWISRYKESNNIKVFVDENWKYFCQFINTGAEEKKYNNHLKLYVPLDKDHIGNGAEIIFDFLEKNNIKHNSKIGKVVRFDDLVIRLYNENDLISLLEFIKNNRYIQEGLIPPNPFTFNKDGLAMACDGYLSYNDTVAKYIYLYLNEKKRNNNLNYVGANDFYNYIQKYYIENIDNLNEENLYNDFFTDDFKDLQEVTTLIINSSKPNFTFKDYLNHFKNSLTYKPKSNVNQNVDNGIEETMSFIIDVMIDKFGYYEAAKANVVEFIRTGDELYLTRNSNLRRLIINDGYREKLIKFLSKINESPSSYIDYVYSKKNNNKRKEQKTSNDQEVSIDKESILNTAIKETYRKYGIEQVISALYSLIYSNKYDRFTRENNVRLNLINFVSAEDAKNIVISTLGLPENIQEISFNQMQEYCNFITSKRIR